MRIQCCLVVCATVVSVGLPAWSQEGSGLNPTNRGWFDGRWQARVELSTGVSGLRGFDPYNLAADSARSTLRSASILGDFYFKSTAAQGSAAAGFSGFRATSGLIVGSPDASAYAGSTDGAAPYGAARGVPGAAVPRTFFGGHADTAPVPYFGLGYTETPDAAGWGFRADFGLMALSPRSAVKFGGVLSGAQGIDDLLRELRLSPLIQLGVSYSF